MPGVDGSFGNDPVKGCPNLKILTQRGDSIPIRFGNFQMRFCRLQIGLSLLDGNSRLVLRSLCGFMFGLGLRLTGLSGFELQFRLFSQFRCNRFRIRQSLHTVIFRLPSCELSVSSLLPGDSFFRAGARRFLHRYRDFDRRFGLQHFRSHLLNHGFLLMKFLLHFWRRKDRQQLTGLK